MTAETQQQTDEARTWLTSMTKANRGTAAHWLGKTGGSEWSSGYPWPERVYWDNTWEMSGWSAEVPKPDQTSKFWYDLETATFHASGKLAPHVARLADAVCASLAEYLDPNWR